MNNHKQQGITMVSWIMILAFLGMVAVAALNIIPAYLNFYQARGIINDLKNDPDIRGKPPSSIKMMIIKRFGVNSVNKIDPKTSVTLKPIDSKNGYYVVLNYEHRGRIIGNLDFVASFEHRVEIYP